MLDKTTYGQSPENSTWGEGWFTRVCRDAASALEQLGRADEKVLEGLLGLTRDEEVGDWVRSALR